MPGISPDIISHRLSVNPAVRPVRQKRRAYDPERYEAMKAEVDRLSSIRFIREVDYPTWLANVVMVRKPRKGWRMCVDYTNLNRACPKDSFPLPRIDQLVDATAGHALLSFMDAYSGYNQIFMHPEDQAHTSFITDRGLYCYKVMPFGLKNAGATYQRLVNHLFAPLIGNTMEVYVDDMLVKSRTADQHIPNLSAMFIILKQYKMRLNPTKCAFGVASGKFLGFMISQRGIEANPEKIQAILDMTIPKTVKDIQSLTGRVAALTRFISKATDRCAPFFKAFKGTKRNITWTAECETAFSELKEYMGRAPLLSTPEHGDILVVYLSVSASAVSSVLIRSKDNAEHPVHYGCGAGLVLVSPDKVALEYALRFNFQASNNEAEYEALLAGLRLAKEMDARQIQIFSDSQLVVHQVNQDFTAKDASMTAYLQHARHLLATFQAHSIKQVPRSENSHADALASLPYLRCLTPEEGHYVLREIHEGICGNHSGARSLAHKAIRQGYFWPSLHTDAQAFTQKCDKCQRFANIPQLPAEPLTAMVSPWPFAQWGLDLIGPMPEGKGQVKYAVVAVDYFTKWAEAEALATITAARIESFVWQNIPILSPMARSKP
ncbi:hypothetical protein L3X38_024037 [Prunus dulcis]|uniref:Uncharacterized protein n=1 Tax=Prunus dulcis TaxID=3755 RepID=A0AAD4VZ05_PRUDU|nr:hypothetical protein L3X38_024037 [Prunus dulcis]